MYINPYYQPYISEDELEHYGVPGMKWGVRKNPDRAYEKAGRKLAKLDRKVGRQNAKAARMEQKAIRKQQKATSPILFKRGKARRAARATSKAIKQYQKAQQKQVKAYRWNEAMTSAFKNAKVSNLNKDTVALGRKYSQMSIDSIMSNNVSVNALMQMEGYYRDKSRR